VDRASLVSELSVTTGQEKLMLDECRELLGIAAKLQVLNCQCYQVFSDSNSTCGLTPDQLFGSNTNTNITFAFKNPISKAG
jgi:hypothetical protein